MTLTTLITINAIIGAAVVYGLLHLLGHAIHSSRLEHLRAEVRTELRRFPERRSDRIAA
jgi:hypothetical protein